MIFTVPCALWKAAAEIEAQVMEQEMAGEDMSFSRRTIVQVAEEALKIDRELEVCANG